MNIKRRLFILPILALLALPLVGCIDEDQDALDSAVTQNQYLENRVNEQGAQIEQQNEQLNQLRKEKAQRLQEEQRRYDESTNTED